MVVLLSIAGTAARLTGQEQGGAIQGVVRDSSKSVLPGAVVEARSPSMPGVATAVSDAAGTYRFPRLPPGTYELTAVLDGFSAAKVSDVVIRLGSDFNIEIVMTVAAIRESIEVTGQSPLIDTRANASTSRIDGDLLSALPASGRDFTDSLTVIGGVKFAPSGVSVEGASGLENNYIVDGVKTTAAVTGASGETVRQDFIEELQVKSSGYNAEYGASMGGVVSVITKSGGDTLKGFSGLYSSGSHFPWQGDIRPIARINPIDNRTPETYVVPNTTHSPNYEVLGDLGGPIVKSRLWFYGSHASVYSPQKVDVKFSSAPGLGTKEFSRYTYVPKTGYSISGAITKNLRARITGNESTTRLRRTLPAIEPDGVTTLANPATRFDVGVTDSPLRRVAAVVDDVVSPHTFVSSTVGYVLSDVHSTPGAYLPQTRVTFSQSNIGLAGVPAELQFPSGYTSTPLSNTGTVKDRVSRWNWDINGTYYGSWHGQHAVKAGVNAEWTNEDALFGATAPNIALQWNRAFVTPDNQSLRGPFGYYSISQNGTFGTGNAHNVALFGQDAWSIGSRLTINAGLRVESEAISSYTPDDPGVTFGFGDKLAPRFGFAWDVRGDAKWKAYGSWGRYYDQFKLRMARNHFGGEISRSDFYSLDTPIWTGIDCKAGPAPAGCPGTYLGARLNWDQVNRRDANHVDPNMGQSFIRETTLGLDHALNAKTSVGVRYLQKALGQLVEDVGIPTLVNNTFTYVYWICNPGVGPCANPPGISPLSGGRAFPPMPKADRKYDALEMKLERRQGQSFFANASYTWSYLRGNTTGLGFDSTQASSAGSVNAQPNVSDQFDSIYMLYNSTGQPIGGRLYTDIPHALKVQAGYALRTHTSVSLDYRAQSGTLLTSLIRQQGVFAVPYLGAGDLGRADIFQQTNIRLEQEISLSKTQKVSVTLDVRNVFDQMAVTYRDLLRWRDSFSIPDNVYFAPGGYDVNAYVQQVRTAAGDPQGLTTLRDNPLFNLPIGWQDRRTLQVGLKYRF